MKVRAETGLIGDLIKDEMSWADNYQAVTYGMGIFPPSASHESEGAGVRVCWWTRVLDPMTSVNL